MGLGKMGVALFMKQGAPIVFRLVSNSRDQEIHLPDSASLRDGITDTLPCPAKLGKLSVDEQGLWVWLPAYFFIFPEETLSVLWTAHDHYFLSLASLLCTLSKLLSLSILC